MSETPNSQAESAPASAEEQTLDKLLAEAQARIDEQRDAWMRAMAEADNVRKRAQADVAAAHKFAVERFAESFAKWATGDAGDDLVRIRGANHRVHHQHDGVGRRDRQLGLVGDAGGESRRPSPIAWFQSCSRATPCTIESYVRRWSRSRRPLKTRAETPYLTVT